VIQASTKKISLKQDATSVMSVPSHVLLDKFFALIVLLVMTTLVLVSPPVSDARPAGLVRQTEPNVRTARWAHTSRISLTSFLPRVTVVLADFTKIAREVRHAKYVFLEDLKPALIASVVTIAASTILPTPTRVCGTNATYVQQDTTLLEQKVRLSASCAQWEGALILLMTFLAACRSCREM
jgi:hypothetical protein